MKKKALIALNNHESLIGPDELAQLEALVEWVAPIQKHTVLADNPGLLSEVQLLVTGWGGARIDSSFLAAAPKLEAVFSISGSVRGCTTPAFWDAGIPITSGLAANSIPTAEFAMVQIMTGLKNADRASREYTRNRGHGYDREGRTPGAYQTTVGLVALGNVARHVIRLLKPIDVELVAYDPYVSEAQAAALGVKLLPLEELFRVSDVVSLHLPLIDATRGVITGAHIASMKRNACLVNTSRGAVIREDEMIAALKERPDVSAALDVTFPEPPAKDSPLWDLENVKLTPHLAGSTGPERKRVTHTVIDEIARFIAGHPLQGQITREQAALMT